MAAEGKGGVVVGSVLPRLPLMHVHPYYAWMWRCRGLDASPSCRLSTALTLGWRASFPSTTF